MALITPVSAILVVSLFLVYAEVYIVSFACSSDSVADGFSRNKMLLDTLIVDVNESLSVVPFWIDLVGDASYALVIADVVDESIGHRDLRFV